MGSLKLNIKSGDVLDGASMVFSTVGILNLIIFILAYQEYQL
jgi:hypothetical protein